MDFTFSHEQKLLRDGLTKFLATRYDLEKSRTAAKTGAGWQPDVWRAFADELGILGAALPEDVGGIGGGPVEVMVIAEALGHALVIEPYVDTAVVAAGLLRRAGGDVATGLLENIVAGRTIVSLAAAEAASGDHWQDVATTARRDGTDWATRRRQDHGRRRPARDAPTGHRPTAGGLSLFLVDVGTPGVDVHGYRTVDDRRAADLVLDAVRLPADALLGDEGRAWPSLERARDEGAAAVCAEAVGACARCWPTPSNTASSATSSASRSAASRCSQHRMVDMHMELEQSVAAVVPRRAQPRSRRRDDGRGRCRPPRPPSAGRPGSSARTPCSCTAAWA